MIHTRGTLLGAIARCMEDKGWSLREFARQTAVTYDSLKDFKWGRTQMLKGDNLQKVVAYLGENYMPMMQVLGYVGAGGEVFPIDDHAKGAGLEEVECPPGLDPASVVPLRIRGDSMYPVFQNGWIVYYSSRRDIVAPEDQQLAQLKTRPISPIDSLADFYGKPCVVKLRDGRALLKTLKKGRSLGLYTLTSYNASDIEDANIEWAARIVFVKIV
ncbi:S24 family peptidase [Acidicapsa acidisoli]|uniref:S24 family peptidase n=1 Tax=Acidicapsa acidisoli TaxID=1615681 RepID=UPI0021E052AE|nr:hypothetical protein [Acidicapsa acidisoli]